VRHLVGVRVLGGGDPRGTLTVRRVTPV